MNYGMDKDVGQNGIVVYEKLSALTGVRYLRCAHVTSATK
eukprot:SAG11_NODE_3079_length_2709_cov_1.445594_2_plen_40_part_00